MIRLFSLVVTGLLLWLIVSAIQSVYGQLEFELAPVLGG